MRIIAGRFGSRRIEAPKGMDTRPTLDQTRESMFNVLQGETEGARVLDLFAGSGALGLEALSRGAVRAVFCDTGREAVKVLRANIAALGVGDETRVLVEDCFAALDRLASEEERFDLIFLDPPYTRDAGPVMKKILSDNLLSDSGLIVLERDARTALSIPEGLRVRRSKVYGRTALDFIISGGEEQHDNSDISRQF